MKKKKSKPSKPQAKAKKKIITATDTTASAAATTTDDREEEAKGKGLYELIDKLREVDERIKALEQEEGALNRLYEDRQAGNIYKMYLTGYNLKELRLLYQRKVKLLRDIGNILTKGEKDG